VVLLKFAGAAAGPANEAGDAAKIARHKPKREALRG
jgi:hypothetical protein